jgi:plastocyanin
LRPYRAALARPIRGCAGAFVFWGLSLIAACDESPLRREAKLDIGSDTISLAPGVKIHDLVLRSVAGGEFEPAATQIRSGDVVRFTTRDSRTHVIEFEEAKLPAVALELFKARTQLRSPPLLVDGATWIVSFEGAPAGQYPFRCVSHGARGSVTVK